MTITCQDLHEVPGSSVGRVHAIKAESFLQQPEFDSNPGAACHTLSLTPFAAYHPFSLAPTLPVSFQLSQSNKGKMALISSQVKSILFKTYLEENENARTWGSGALQPLVAEVSITTRNTCLSGLPYQSDKNSR